MNCETVTCTCFKTPDVWYLAMAGPGHSWQMPIPALHRLGCLLRVRRAAWRPMVPPPTKDHETVEVQTDAPFNIRVTQSHGPQAKPLGGPGGQTLLAFNGATQLFKNEAWRGLAGGPSPRRSQATGTAHGHSGSISRHGLQSGMLLEGHGQESGCCLVQKPAKFPSAGLD